MLFTTKTVEVKQYTLRIWEYTPQASSAAVYQSKAKSISVDVLTVFQAGLGLLDGRAYMLHIHACIRDIEGGAIASTVLGMRIYKP